MTAASTRQRLIEAARQCLLERGHQACPVKAIAAAAGVNHGLVHHYFGSKEGLWLAVIDNEGARVRDALAAAPERFLEGFFGPELLKRSDRLRLVVEFLGLAKSRPQVAALLRENFRLNRQMVGRVLGLSEEPTAALVFAALFGLAIQSGLDPDLPVEAAVQSLLGLLAARGEGPATKPARSAS
jgi:AcrR family transcriptional regulator